MRSFIPCPSLRAFKCHYVNFSDFTLALANEFGRLLLSAGERLEDFEFIIQAEAELNDGVDFGMFSIYLCSFSNNQFSQMPNSNSLTSLETPILDGSNSRLKTTDTSFLSSDDLPSPALRLPN